MFLQEWGCILRKKTEGTPTTTAVQNTAALTRVNQLHAMLTLDEVVEILTERDLLSQNALAGKPRTSGVISAWRQRSLSEGHRGNRRTSNVSRG
jgi:hypothetical protein